MKYLIVILLLFYSVELFGDDSSKPSLSVNWYNKKKTKLIFSIEGKDPELIKCIDNGLEARYRIEATLCKSRNLWFDKCPLSLVDTYFLSYDPISETYKVEIDRHRDNLDPLISVFNKRELALQAFKDSMPVHIDFFAGGRAEFLTNKKLYIKARAFSTCKGEYNSTFSDISYYLTLGLIRVEGFNTGWNTYLLD